MLPASGLVLALLFSTGCASYRAKVLYEQKVRHWYIERESIYQDLLSAIEGGDPEALYYILKRLHGGVAGVDGSEFELRSAEVQQSLKILEERKNELHRMQAFAETTRDYPQLRKSYGDSLVALEERVARQQELIKAIEEQASEYIEASVRKELPIVARLPGRNTLRKWFERNYVDSASCLETAKTLLAESETGKSEGGLAASNVTLTMYPRLRPVFQENMQQVEEASWVVDYYRHRMPRTTAEWGQYIDALLGILSGRERYQEALRAVICERRPAVEGLLRRIFKTIVEVDLSSDRHAMELGVLVEIHQQILEQEEAVRSGRMPKIDWPREIDPAWRDEISHALQRVTRGRLRYDEAWRNLDQRLKALRRDLESSASELRLASALNRERLRDYERRALAELDALQDVQSDLAFNASLQQATIHSLYRAEYRYVTRDVSDSGRIAPFTSLFSVKRMIRAQERIVEARQLAEEGRLASPGDLPAPLALFILHPDVQKLHRQALRAGQRAARSVEQGWAITERIEAFDLALRLREAFIERLRELQDGLDEAGKRLERADQRLIVLIREVREDIEEEERRVSALEAVRRRLVDLEEQVPDPSVPLPHLTLPTELGNETREGIREEWRVLSLSSKPNVRLQVYRRVLTLVEQLLKSAQYDIGTLREDIEKMQGLHGQSKDGIMYGLSPLLERCILENGRIVEYYRTYLEILRDF